MRLLRLSLNGGEVVGTAVVAVVDPEVAPSELDTGGLESTHGLVGIEGHGYI